MYHVMRIIVLSTLLACPDTYTDMSPPYSTRACLRFVATPTTYPDATRNCTADGGDIVKIDTPDMRLTFLHFIKGMII